MTYRSVLISRLTNDGVTKSFVHFCSHALYRSTDPQREKMHNIFRYSINFEIISKHTLQLAYLLRGIGW